MPAGIPFIISNEFAERFCFYGINSILTVYLVSSLHFTDAKAARTGSSRPSTHVNRFIQGID